MAGMGAGLTSLVAGLAAQSTDVRPSVTMVTLTAVVIHLSLLATAAHLLRGSRSLWVYRRIFRETASRPTSTDPGGRIGTLAGLALLGLVLGLIAANVVADVDWSYIFGNWSALGVGLSFLLAPTLALMVLVAGKTAFKERAVVTGVGLALVAWLILWSGSDPLRALVAAGPSAERMAAWSAFAFLIGIAVLLMVGFDSDEQSLKLHLKWDNGQAQAQPALIYNPKHHQIYRRSRLTVSSEGHPLLLLTTLPESDDHVVRAVSDLSKQNEIDLNETAFAIWDLKAAARQALPSGEAAKTSIGDAGGLVSFNVEPYAAPTPAALSKPLVMSEKAVIYLNNLLFQPTDHGLQMRSAIGRAINLDKKVALEDFDLAQASASWVTDASSLTFATDVQAWTMCTPIDRSPAAKAQLESQLAEGKTIRDRIKQEIAALEKVQMRLEEISNKIRDSIERYFVEEIDLLLNKDRSLDPNQRKGIHTIIGLLNFSANPTIASCAIGDRIKVATQTIDRLEADLKESKADLKAAHGEVMDLVQKLLNNPHPTPAQQKFLQQWYRPPPVQEVEDDSARARKARPAGRASTSRNPPSNEPGDRGRAGPKSKF